LRKFVKLAILLRLGQVRLCFSVRQGRRSVMDCLSLCRGLVGVVLTALVCTGCSKPAPVSQTAPRQAEQATVASAVYVAPAGEPNPVVQAAHQEALHIETTWIADDYFAALIFHPRQILAKQTPEAASEAWLDAAAGELGLTLSEVDQICLLLGPPEGGASPAPAPISTTWIFRFSTPAAQQAMLRRFLGEHHHQEAARLGHVYYRDSAAPVAISAPDERTVLFASERNVKRALAASRPRSLLLSRLANVSGRPDIVGVVDAAPVRPLLRRATGRTGDAPPPAWVRQIADIMNQMKAATLTADFEAAPLAHLAMEAEDSQAAVQLEQLAQGYRAAAAVLLPALQGQWVRGEDAQGYAPLFALAGDLLSGVTVERQIRQVSVDIAAPPALDRLPQILEAAYLAAARNNAREDRVQRLQLVGLALHNHHVATGSFPAGASRDAAGRPLLSWRVHLLPFLGEEELYRQFRLDEPWDSAHNRTLIEKIPSIYHDTGSPVTGRTRTVGLIGPDTPLGSSRGVSLGDFADGPDDTILVVECGADRAVPWTSPEDLPFDPQNPIAVLGSVEKAGFLALFGDGRVEIIQPRIAPNALKALLTHAGREPK
jgi:hypothetical protein